MVRHDVQYQPQPQTADSLDRDAFQFLIKPTRYKQLFSFYTRILAQSRYFSLDVHEDASYLAIYNNPLREFSFLFNHCFHQLKVAISKDFLSMKKRFSSIQAARTVAILMVLVVHVGAIARALGAPQQVAFLDFGSAGVDLFFVVSGFIMSVVATGSEKDPWVFFRKRFLRIYPMYWLFTLIWWAMSVVVGRADTDILFLAKSLAIWPQSEMPYLFVGWSLEHEIIFYGVVGVLLTFRAEKHLVQVLTMFFFIGVVNSVAVPAIFKRPPIWECHLFSLYNFDFLIGVLIFKFRTGLVFRKWRELLFGSLIAFPLIAFFLLPHYEPQVLPTQPQGWIGLIRVITFGLAGAGVVIGLLSAEHYVRERGLVWSLLEKIGDASFALYLSHHIIFAIFAYSALHTGLSSVFLWPIVIVSVVTAISFSVVWYDKVEVPYNKFANKLFSPLASRHRS